MIPNDVDAPIVPIWYAPEFKRNLRQLAKKYRRIKIDVQPLLGLLSNGEVPGDQVPGVQYEVFKVRVGNSDGGKGKSGGYRVIYQRTADGIILVTIYSKLEQDDIAPTEIRTIIAEHEREPQELDQAALPSGLDTPAEPNSPAGED